jgi:hypothetical protein
MVHHSADSGMNALIRVKLAGTGNRPEIRLYEERKSAIPTHGGIADFDDSLPLLPRLQAKWLSVLH